MKIIGNDTTSFLNKEKEVAEYIGLLDKEFSEIGVDSNYIVLTKVKKEEYDFLCVCFYFGNMPVEIKESQMSSILADHIHLLEKLNVLIHFSSCLEEELIALESNPTVEARIELFERTIS